MAQVAYVIIGYDPDPDLSWLDDDCHGPAGSAYRDPANHVTLEMTAYDTEGEVIDNLCGIDFLTDGADWETGEFSHVSGITGDHLRNIACEMGLPE